MFCCAGIQSGLKYKKQDTEFIQKICNNISNCRELASELVITFKMLIHMNIYHLLHMVLANIN